MIDIGVNLTDKRFRQDIDAVIQRARAAGIQRQIVTGTSVQNSRQAIQLCQQYPSDLYATAGVHPHDAQHWNDTTATELEALITAPEVVAVGETGLDFNRDFSPRPLQEQAFQAQLELAIRHKKALFLHERDAHERFYALLKPIIHQLTTGVVHCFTGTETTMRRYLDLGLYIGITGWVCDERRGQALQQIVRYIPDDRLLIETDAPYLIPRDLPEHLAVSGVRKRNEPAFLPHIARRLAELRDQEESELIKHCRANAIKCFSLLEN